ncbi:hypothetical protein CK203_030780 [Vitis vinifera]|uniref:Uncharacterized protein n=1 Tax=Vitis vinifera TaxID=29760 RepID=A0A438ICX4_VITVI|nr:hypothetical protein CK203_030780 [Vitis vinifera]
MSSNYEHVDPVAQSAELRRKKRIKYIAYFAAFVVFQTLVKTAFALTVMLIKNPQTPTSGTSNSRIALSRLLMGTLPWERLSLLRLAFGLDQPERLQLGIVLHPVQSDGTVVLNYSPADSGTRDTSLAAPLGRGKTTGSCLLPHRKEYKPAITIDMPSKLHGLQLELLV